MNNQHDVGGLTDHKLIKLINRNCDYFNKNVGWFCYFRHGKIGIEYHLIMCSIPMNLPSSHAMTILIGVVCAIQF